MLDKVSENAKNKVSVNTKKSSCCVIVCCCFIIDQI